jgi:hypothetical protein
MATSERRTTGRVTSHGGILHREYMLSAGRPPLKRDRLTDVSEEGVSFTTSNKYAENMLLEAHLELTGWAAFRNEFYFGDASVAAEPLVVILRVTTSRGVAQKGGDAVFRVGCVFESIDESHASALARYLAHRRQRAL